MKTVITLTTDFGTADGFAGMMKGVIISISPEVEIIDLSHDIEPQNILEGQFIISRAAPYFPKGTIHVAVVDPGVGTDRRAIAVKTTDAIWVGPDNGIFTPWFAGAEIVALTNSDYFLRSLSATFHGRDIFAPVAAHLANDVPLSQMGAVINNPVLLEMPRRKVGDVTIEGEIIHIDRFGNLITNIPEKAVVEFQKEGHEPVIKAGDNVISGLCKTYAEARDMNVPIALIGSHGNLEIAILMGNARAKLGLTRGLKVVVGAK